MKYAKFKYPKRIPKLALGGNTDDDGEQLYNSTKQTIGAVPVLGPVINGVVGIGDTVAKPIKTRVERTDENGNLVDSDAASRGYLAGTLTNPYRSVTRTLSDKQAPTGWKVASVLTGGISGAFDLKGQGRYLNKIESDAKAKIQAQKDQEAAQAAEEQRIQDEYNAIQQTNINNNYLNNHSVTGDNGAIYAKYGAKLPKYNTGGYLNPIASDTQKAIGKTHEQGGIKLKSNGIPYAEIEDQEIIKDDQVYSDRLRLPNGNTVAEEAEKLGKIKGKNESKVNSTDYRQSNSASRMIDIADQKLDQLFNYQEANKPVQSNYKMAWGGNPNFSYGTDVEDDALSSDFANFQANYKPKRNYNYKDSYNSTPENDAYNMSLYSPEARELLLNPSGSDSSASGRSFNWEQAAQSAIPFVDNIYNAYQISKTPDIPEFTKKQYYSQQALPMKTKYDISGALSRGNDAYRTTITDLNNTTNNNQVARANKLGAYATLLKSNNDLYQNKANIETQLANLSNQNIQNVYNENIRNKQNIDNLNLSQEDQRRFAKLQRQYNIMNAKMSNVANATEDASQLARDYNMRNLDKEKMNLDSARYTKEEQAAIKRRKAKNNIK